MTTELPTLEELKNRSGASYREIAARCETTESTVYAWVKKNRVTPGNYAAFAEAVGVDESLIRRISSGSTNSTPAPKGDVGDVAWTKAVLRSSLPPEARTVVLAFLLLVDPETGQATVTQEDVQKAANLTPDLVGRAWDLAINSSFVERTGSEAVERRGVWVLKLRMPET